MSGTKFFIHGGETWRELDENNGRVSGWGKIQFVYLSRGRLIVARHNSVLRGLRALLAGKPTTVRDGPRLQVIRSKKRGKKEYRIKQNESNHCNCCTCQHAFHHNHQLATDIIFNNLLKQNTNSTATQCALTNNEPVKEVQHLYTAERKKHTQTKERERIGSQTFRGKNVPRKELIIDEDDVLLVRTFIEHDKRNVFNISLVEYDADDNCKRSVFYKINPLVVVEKSIQIAQMIRPPSQCSSVSLKEFVAHLGLQSIHEVSKKSKYKMRQRKNQHSLRDHETNDRETDKENIVSIRRSYASNQKERNFLKKSHLVQRDAEKKSYNYEPLKKLVSDYPARKFSGVKNKSLLNMARRVQLSKNIKINKKEVANTLRESKKNNDKKILQKKDMKSPRDIADDKSLKRSRKNNVSIQISSDSDSLTDKEKNNSRNISHTLRSISRNRSAAPVDTDSQVTKKSRNISTIDYVKRTEQLSQSLPTSHARNKIAKLPLESSSDNDTFQKDKTSEKPKMGNVNTDTTSKQQKGKPKGSRYHKTSEKPNTTSKGALRVYSRAEDEAIVSWLKTSDRANLVNGNRIWKELKPIHYQTTGHHRPWQSLRNRYLRYILPALSSLAVPPALAQSLRAAAAQGEIKSKNNSNSANNSIFKSAPVRSAWALRPRSPARSPPSSPSSSRSPRPSSPSPITSKSLRSRTQTSAVSTSKSRHQSDDRPSDTADTSGANRSILKRSLRSSAAHSPTLPTPKAKARRDSLTYSELTRRFASRHRSTPQSDSSLDTRGEKRLHDSSDTSNSPDNSEDSVKIKRVTRRDSQVSPSLLSEATRRKSKRLRSKTPERSRTRRLYNPRAV